MPELIDVIDRAWYALVARPAVVMAGVVVGVAAVDTGVKAALLALLGDGHSFPQEIRTFGLRVVQRSGLVDSTPSGVIYVVVVLAVTVAAVLVLRWLRSPTWAVALGLVVGGVLGNLVDRLFRGTGAPAGPVVDVFAIGSLGFNVADGAICVGVVLMLVLLRVGSRIDAMLRPAPESARPAEAEPYDEVVFRARRPKYPARKWEQQGGASQDAGDTSDPGLDGSDAVVDEDDRPPSARPSHPATKWDRG